MENSEIAKLVELAFREGVDETLATLCTEDHPKSEGWKDFIDKEWDAAKNHLLRKIK